MSFDLKVKNGDLVIENGDLKTVVDTEKLTQDILKIALSPIGSNILNPWYGSHLSKNLIGSGLSTDIVLQFGQSQLQQAIENLKELQEMQIRTSQSVSADEQIAAISHISVNRNRNDPRLFDVIIKVITKGYKPATAAFKVSTI